MAKNVEINENIIKSPLNQLISERYGDYAKDIIQERALPDARDGLKPVQRRILYSMAKDGNTADKGFRKSAKTVGNVIGTLHPHGDSSVYEAMVRLSQSWKINYPLVEMHGNNGSIDDDPAAAMRYTEARLASVSDALLEDIDKDTVSWSPNYDDTMNEPTVLPAKFPNLLVNGSTGIAAGYATNIAPHNLKEIIAATIYRIKNPNCTLDDLMLFVKGPDFPTKAIVQGKKEIKEIFSTGKGKVVVRAKAEIVQTKTIKQIVVTEIPYEVIKCNIVKKIDDIRFAKDIDGILDCRDESDRNGLRIVVDINKDSDAEMILNYLYKNTDLQVYYNYNMIAIVNNRPTLLTLSSALDAYIDFARKVILNRSKFEFDKRINRCHILEGLIKAISVLDEVIAIIRSSKDKADAKLRLIDRFKFSDAQAEAIVVLRLYRLTNTDVYELKNEYQQLVDELKVLKEIIENPVKLDEVLSSELSDVSEKYGHDRYTVIEDEVQDIQIDKLSMITNETVMVALTRDGYIKRTSLRSYNSSDSILPGVKNDDEIIGTIQAETLDNLIAFTVSGEYVIVPIYTIDESKWKDIGQHISKYIKINNNEKFVNAYIVKDFNTNAYFVSATKNGMIKKSSLPNWQLQRTSKSSTAMNLSENDQVISVQVGYDDQEIYLVTKDGYGNRYSLNELSDIAPKSKGVKAVKLIGEDELVSMQLIDSNDSDVVYISENNLAKRVKLENIEITNRATKGVVVAKKVKSNPYEIKYALCNSINSNLNIISDNNCCNIAAKDIGLLTVDSRLVENNLPKNCYHYDGIKEVKIVDFKNKNVVKDFEEIKLDV